MTGTPGAATAGDGEAPERSPPFSPNYDLTGKVGGLCAQCWGPPRPALRDIPPDVLCLRTLCFPVYTPLLEVSAGSLV